MTTTPHTHLDVRPGSLLEHIELRGRPASVRETEQPSLGIGFRTQAGAPIVQEQRHDDRSVPSEQDERRRGNWKLETCEWSNNRGRPHECD